MGRTVTDYSRKLERLTIPLDTRVPRSPRRDERGCLTPYERKALEGSDGAISTRGGGVEKRIEKKTD